MYIRKFAAAAGIATGAALAFAPLAAADPAAVDPTLVTSTLDSEIASQNSLFEFDALLAGDYGDITKGGAGVYDTFTTPAELAKDAPQAAPFSTLDYELYGVSPGVAGVTNDTGPYSELNGALIQFDNAYNVELYASANGGALDTNLGDYLYNGTIQNVLANPLETTTAAFDTLYNRGIGDLSGFFQTNLSFLDISTGAPPPPVAFDSVSGLSSLISGEISSANSLFESDASLTGVDDVIKTAGTFDTVPVGDLTNATGAATPFDYSLYGLNPLENATSDPGAYDLFNGAVVRFDDAINFGVYALENGGSAIPVADFATDLFGNQASLATELTGMTASQAITDLLGNAYSDLLGYFDFGSLAGM